LLLDAMKVTLTVADSIGLYALTLDAVDKDKAAIYAKLGFIPFIEGD
jgi:hypothetical protein